MRERNLCKANYLCLGRRCQRKANYPSSLRSTTVAHSKVGEHEGIKFALTVLCSTSFFCKSMIETLSNRLSGTLFELNTLCLPCLFTWRLTESQQQQQQQHTQTYMYAPQE